MPNTRRFVQRLNITTLDFLFNEDGLLPCSRNDAAIATVIDILKSDWPDVPPVPPVPDWLDALLSLWFLLLPLIICVTIWDWIGDLCSDPRPSRRLALRDRFPNGYVLLLIALLLWLPVIITIYEVLSLLFSSDVA